MYQSVKNSFVLHQLQGSIKLNLDISLLQSQVNSTTFFTIGLGNLKHKFDTSSMAFFILVDYYMCISIFVKFASDYYLTSSTAVVNTNNNSLK